MVLTDHLVLPMPERPGSRPAPLGMDLIESELLRGLPARLFLVDDLALVVAAPTGAYARWPALPPETIVFASADEAAPFGTQSHAASGAKSLPVRLYLMAGTRIAASVPLRPGRRWLLPETGAPLIELVVLEAVITAGAACGAPMSGARLRLAWRRPGRVAGMPLAGELLPPAPVHPAVAARRIRP